MPSLVPTEPLLSDLGEHGRIAGQKLSITSWTVSGSMLEIATAGGSARLFQEVLIRSRENDDCFSAQFDKAIDSRIFETTQLKYVRQITPSDPYPQILHV